MHSFIKTIGFQSLKNKAEVDQIIQKIIEKPDKKNIVKIPSADTTFVQLWKEFGTGFGISVVGEIADNDEINVEYYFPYIEGSDMEEQMELQIEKFSDKEAYAAISENLNLGINLIFYMQNSDEFLENEQSNEYYVIGNKVKLAALASQGVVLLQLNKNNKSSKEEEEINKNRKKLMEAAKAGDMQAIESLTLEDMDMYSSVARRSKKEDVLTIVDTYIMPYGIESDQYSILGTIQQVQKTENYLTKETIYMLLVECNNLHIRIGINEKDLMGEPEAGRRLKANIWLQGNVRLLKWS